MDNNINYTYVPGRISVIIPCYHAGKYMEKIYDNLRKQTFTNFEAILVNDGDEGQIEQMQSIASKDERIKVVWKENGGASSARNLGISMARSEWIVFVDADDSIKPTYLERLFKSVNNTDAEMGIGGYTTIYTKSARQYYYPIKVDEAEKIVYDFCDAYEYIQDYGLSYYPWNKIFKTSFIHKHKITMDENIGVIHDAVFIYELFRFIKNVSLIPDSGYIYYREDAESLVSCYDKNIERDRRLVLMLNDEINHLVGWPEERCKKFKKKYLADLAIIIITNLFKNKSPLSFSEKERRIEKEIYEKEDIIDALKSISSYSVNGKLTRYMVLHSSAFVVTVYYTIVSWLRYHLRSAYAFVQPWIN